MNQQDNAAVELSRNGVARYVQLGTLFRRRVETGEWPVGEQIPTIDDLAGEFGVAKLTIRQALGLLEKDGLIDRFRAKGTFVKARPSRELWCDVHTDFSGMLRARKGATIEILNERKRSGLPQDIYAQGKPAPAYRFLRRRHSRDGQAFLLADLYIDERLTRNIPRAAYTTKTALKLISDVSGIRIATVKQTLTIGMAALETSRLLGLDLNAPVAFVERAAMGEDGTMVLLTNGTYRGDVVRLDMQTNELPAKGRKT